MSTILGPMQVVLITANGEMDFFGKKREMTDVDIVHWHCAVSSEERKYAIVIQNSRPILDLILKTGVFIINFMPSSVEENIQKLKGMAANEPQKIQKIGFTTTDGDGVDVPKIRQALATIDCNVSETKKFSDYTLIIANIIKTDLKAINSRLFQLDDGRYTTTKEF